MRRRVAKSDEFDVNIHCAHCAQMCAQKIPWAAPSSQPWVLPSLFMLSDLHAFRDPQSNLGTVIQVGETQKLNSRGRLQSPSVNVMLCGFDHTTPTPHQHPASCVKQLCRRQSRTQRPRWRHVWTWSSQLARLEHASTPSPHTWWVLQQSSKGKLTCFFTDSHR